MQEQGKIYSINKENNNFYDGKRRINKNYDILVYLEKLIDREIKFEDFFKYYNTVINYLSEDTYKEIDILSSFVKKNICKVQLYILKKGIDYNNVDEITNVLVILNLINELQTYYIDFVYNRCNFYELENFDANKGDNYCNLIYREIQKLKIN
ncbi:MAG: hypothetical protein IJD92_04955 [Bacilli bacterium]|nr:hypothetical protein [Bacilli bacterium]